MKTPDGYEVDIDLGGDHYLAWAGNQPDGTPKGVLIWHKRVKGDEFQPAGEFEAAGVWWEQPNPGDGKNYPLWQVESLGEHLTLSPSILCDCGDHGFVREGKWVSA